MQKEEKYNLLVITGATATGKTRFAAHLASQLNALGEGVSEILSADSRQVYRGMDVGTGKDIEDYTVDGYTHPYHLIDIEEAGAKYNLFRYQCDFVEAYNAIRARGNRPIMCGGSGLYVEAVVKNYGMTAVEPNPELRARLEGKTLGELRDILASYKRLHNETDTDTCQRAIRAIEIEEYYRTHREEVEAPAIKDLRPLVVALDVDRETRRQRISSRLKNRVDGGLVKEVERLIADGVKPEDLIYYGLEYKFVTQYVTGVLGYDEMLNLLEIAIHQFAKRQMTWLRGMERRGTVIHWIDANGSLEEQLMNANKLLAELGYV